MAKDDDKKKKGMEYGQKGMECVEEGDFEKAVEWFKKGADLGNDVCTLNLAVSYRNGYGVEQDLDEYYNLVKAGYERSDNPYYEYELASCYLEGIGVEESYEKFMELLCDAADKGLREARYTLGFYTLYGIGAVERSVSDGLQLLCLSAADGDTEAMAELARIDDEKIARFDPDEEEGEPLTDEQIEKIALGELCVGMAFKEGRYVEESREDALKWLERAAANGNADAMFELVYMYGDENDPWFSLEKAASYAATAAEKGNTPSMALIGYFYKNGLGVEQSDKKAREWLEKGASLGDEDAKKYLEEFFGEQ